MDVARIGLAHGSLEDHLETYERVRTTASDMDADLAVLVDLPGPKIRCAPFAEGGVNLETGSTVRVSAGSTSSSSEVIEVDYEELVTEVRGR